MISLHDIASYCGVSVSTVSKALHDYPDISSSTSRMIREAAAALGYKAEPKKPVFTSAVSRRTGLLIMKTKMTAYEQFYYNTIFKAFSQTMCQRGFSPLILYQFSEPGSVSILSSIRFQKPDGLCIVGMERMHPEIREILEDGTPAICIDYLLDQHRCILSSQEEAVRALLWHCRMKGHTNIAWLDIHGSGLTRRCRREYSNYISDMGLPASYAACAGFDGYGSAAAAGSAVRNSCDNIHERLQDLLSLTPSPTCIICSDDITAYKCISELHRLGLRVPDDFSVAGIGACSDYLGEQPVLTSVNLFPDIIGQRAAQDLADLIEDPSSVEIRPGYADMALIPGKTVAERKKDA